MVLQWIDNSIISHSRWRSPTNKLVWANYSTDQKNFTGPMFTIKLEEKSYKISFKALPFKIHWSKNRQRAHCAPSLSGPDRVKKTVLNIFPKSKGKHLHQRLFFNKVTGFQPASLLKKRLRHRCFSFEIFENTLLIEHLRAAASTSRKFFNILIIIWPY